MITAFHNPHDMYLLERPMEVVYAEHAIVLPRLQQGDYPMWGLGGVCDENNAFIDLSFYDGGWATHGGKYAWEEEDYQDCTVLYFGCFFRHWGHFLVDEIGRLWYYLQAQQKETLKIAYLGEEEPAGNFLQFFELLGIKQEQLIRITKPTRFRKVIVPEFSCLSCVWYTREYRNIFDAIAQAVEELPACDVPRKVYFSRLRFGKAMGSEFGEEYLAKWLTDNGYTAVSPEKLSLIEQVSIWNRAEQIACLDGSIPLNLDFCRNAQLQLLVMHKTHLEHLNLELTLLMRPCRVTLLDAYYEPYKKYPTSIGAGPFLLCISQDVLRYSREQGLVMPFSEAQLRQQRRRGVWLLTWRIINLKGRIRMLASKLLPRKVKSAIRKVISGVKGL